MIKKLIKLLEFIKFCIVGVSNTMISLCIYTIIIYLGGHYIFASTLGYMVGILNAYILSSKFVFKQNLDKEKGFKFIFIYLTALVINLCIITVLIECLGVNKILAQILSTGFNCVYNYALNKIWTFKNRK